MVTTESRLTPIALRLESSLFEWMSPLFSILVPYPPNGGIFPNGYRIVKEWFFLIGLVCIYRCETPHSRVIQPWDIHHSRVYRTYNGSFVTAYVKIQMNILHLSNSIKETHAVPGIEWSYINAWTISRLQDSRFRNDLSHDSRKTVPRSVVIGLGDHHVIVVGYSCEEVRILTKSQTCNRIWKLRSQTLRIIEYTIDRPMIVKKWH